MTSTASPRRRRRLFEQPEPAIHRNLECTRCGDLVAVLEACTGGRTLEDHRWLDPATYECGQCLEELDAAARARATNGGPA